MEVQSVSADNTAWAADALVVGLFGKTLGPAAHSLNQQLGGLLEQLIEGEEVRGSAGEVTKLLGHQGLPPTVIVLGLGEAAALNPVSVRRAAGAASVALAGRPRAGVEFQLDLPSPALHSAALLGALAGCVGSDLHREKAKLHPFQQVQWGGLDAKAVARAAAIAEGLNFARELVNHPANVIYPESFVDEATQSAASVGLAVEVWDESRLAQERCGALLAVARGSAKPPRLLIVRHQGAAADAPWLALAGKGVTFDSGGLSLKPNESMKTMKGDMAGAASVVGAMQAIASLQLPV